MTQETCNSSFDLSSIYVNEKRKFYFKPRIFSFTCIYLRCTLLELLYIGLLNIRIHYDGVMNVLQS